MEKILYSFIQTYFLLIYNLDLTLKIPFVAVEQLYECLKHMLWL